MKNIKAEIIVEGANSPLTTEADDYLTKQGVTIVPDILANSGGVIVSYFEWAQNIQVDKWDINKSKIKLDTILKKAFNQVNKNSKKYNISLRQSAYLIGVSSVYNAAVARGY